MYRFALLSIVLLAGCETLSGPDARDGFAERNIGKTVVTHVERLGTQAVYFDPTGQLHLWSAASDKVQRGAWRYDLLATGAATTYQGAAGINYSVEELATDWGVCFQYLDEAGKILRRSEGGDWNCALFADFEALIIDKSPGDAFGLLDGTPPATMPATGRIPVAGLKAL